MRSKYEQRGYCSLCQKWYKLSELTKIYIKKFGVYAYYCPIHRKQVRLKPRGKSMKEVKTR